MKMLEKLKKVKIFKYKIEDSYILFLVCYDFCLLVM